MLVLSNHYQYITLIPTMLLTGFQENLEHRRILTCKFFWKNKPFIYFCTETCKHFHYKIVFQFINLTKFNHGSNFISKHDSYRS